MEVRQLRFFLCVARLRNISRAAERLHVAQPALSRQMHQLEEELGVVLLNRGLRGVELTADGERLVPLASALVQRADALLDEFNPRSGSGKQDLSVGMPEGLARDLLPALASQYASKYPFGRLNIKIGLSASIEKWIENSEVDIGILYGFDRGGDPRFINDVLVTESLCAVAAADYASNALPEIAQGFEFSRLALHPLVLTSPANSVRRALDRVGQEVGVPIRSQLEVDSFSMLLDFVRQKRGVTVLTRSSIADEIASHHLMAWTIIEPCIDIAISIVMLRACQPSQPLRSLIQMLKAELAPSTSTSGNPRDLLALRTP